MSSKRRLGTGRLAAAVAVLASVMVGCGSAGGEDFEKQSAALPSSAPPSSVASTPIPSATSEKKAALDLTDDEGSGSSGKRITVDVLANDKVVPAAGKTGALTDLVPETALTLTIDVEPVHGTAVIDGTSISYTSDKGYDGSDEFTYRVKATDPEDLSGKAVVRINVKKPVPKPSPTPEPTKEPVVHYQNCSAARADGAAPVRTGDPGYGSHLDRDGDGVGCEPSGWNSDDSSGSSTGGSTGGSTDGSSSTYYQNCSAARADGAAPVRTGDPGYGSHLDRDGDGVGCE